MRWVIDKSFSFCYGHRVWTQKLEEEFCAVGDNLCKCRHLHGHEGLVRINLASNSLHNSMVTDFKHLGWLKDFLDDTLDHKFIIDRNDPMFNFMVHEPWDSKIYWGKYNDVYTAITIPGTDKIIGYILNLTNVDHQTPLYEILSGFFIVDFVPTSEELAKWLYEIVKIKMSKIDIESVEWCETPKSSAIYFKGEENE